MTRWANYADYLASDEWDELRTQTLARDDYACRLCNSRVGLEVHHRRYPRIWGTETVDDLTTLCDECHSKFHFPPPASERESLMPDEHPYWERQQRYTPELIVPTEAEAREVAMRRLLGELQFWHDHLRPNDPDKIAQQIARWRKRYANERTTSAEREIIRLWLAEWEVRQ